MTATTRPPIALRHFILARISVLVVVTALLVGASFLQFGLFPLGEQLAKNQFDSVTSRIETGLSSVFEPPVQLLSMSRGWLAGKAPDLESADAFNRLFQPILETSPQITSVVAGTSTGQGWLLLQQADGSWRNRMTDVDRWGQRQLIFERFADGRFSKRWEQQNYDPRNRPWYRAAVTGPHPRVAHWTSPYTFFTTGDPGITASTRVQLTDGRELVLGFDLMLRDLSLNTQSATVGIHGMTLILTEDERVLALPAKPDSVTQDDWIKKVLKPAAELGILPVKDAIQAWHKTNPSNTDVWSFGSGEVRWFAGVHTYLLGAQKLWVMTLAPAKDFDPAWLPIIPWLASAAAIALGVAVFLARFETRKLTQPLERLATINHQIGKLDFHKSSAVHSGIAEIRELAMAQDAMLEMLQDNQQQLDSSADALRRQIVALTTAEDGLQLAASVFIHAREGITITDSTGAIVDVNDTFCVITGYSKEEAIGRNPSFLRSGQHGQEFYAAMWRDLLANDYWQGEIWNRRKDGELYAAMTTISTVRDAQGSIAHFVALFSDVTAIKQHERELDRMAHYDALTSLPNRVLLGDRLQQAKAQVQRRGERMGVAYLDIDGFKTINDRHGHDVGDQLLVTIAGRMKNALREGDTLARLGGDEFVAVLLDLAEVESSVPLLGRLLSAAAEPVQIGPHLLQVSASLGVTFFPQSDPVDADQLLRQADQAMYQAKLAGKNRFFVFDAEQDRSVRGHHEGVERIRRALIDDEFVLFFQPKVNMFTGEVVGAEALIRWQHPENGLVAPGVFLPLIDEHPLAINIGEWVIHSALTQMESWQAAGLALDVSVNIGARQLQQIDFPQRLREILAAHPRIPPQRLELEVLETSALEDVARVSRTIHECRGIGVSFALDDFGTGYSSLTYLKRLPVTRLKIDQSFVRDMLDDTEDLAILDGVLSLAVAFGRDVIAEGVETVAQGTMLLQLGCTLGQGYGIARPMPGSEFLAWTSSWQVDALWTAQRVVKRVDLPLLFAGVEHRAWITGMELFLRGERAAPPPMDLLQCRFGHWIESEGRARYGSKPAFHRIEDLHRQVHAQAARQMELLARAEGAQALAQMAALFLLRDALLAEIALLLSESAASS